MMNNKGSVLTITLAFVIGFLLLGLATIHHAGLQNTASAERQASEEAFWLADGAVEVALGRLKENTLNTIPKSQAAVSLGRGTYDVVSYADSCPSPICSNLDRMRDPLLPSCSSEDRSQDPILCDPKDRLSDPMLCLPSSRVPDLSDCTEADRLLDPAGLNRCPCEVNESCTMLCPCQLDGTCTGRCPCEYQAENPCVGRCPCEITKPPSCECNVNNTCPPNMIGRCPCEYLGSCCESWVIQSYGEVDYGSTEAGKDIQLREVRAKVAQDLGGYNVYNALESWGFVNKDRDCVPDGNSEIEGGCVQNSDFTFESVFGKSYQYFIDNATHIYTDPKNNFEGIVEGITIINLTGKNSSLNINEDKQAYDADGIPIASLLIIDASQVDPGKNVMITIAGNGVFRGIVWIIGEAQLVGTSSIYGAVFVAGSETDYTKVSGTTDVYFSAKAIAEAISTFDPNLNENEGYVPTLTYINWRETGIPDKSEYQ